ncbi:LacI family DNA-binding transcriptional regulator [Deinococcus detaillensis]|uniref:LacI family DNA-binding transcriptional regulator n=1 Tax=Deinococcus detaillensis TaxID=2592048 RepID=UPI001CDD119B|nr:LacI family DNA-binding transcriptional regulator [Deinococcus detaillensis]
MTASTTQTVTLVEVAREAGVSPSTVSRILNGSAKVASDKRARVEAAIHKLEFAPNAQAQALAGGRSFSVGVLTQNLSSPFYGETLAGIERGLVGTPYHLLAVSGHWDAEQEREALNLLLRRRVDALIVLGGVIEDAALNRAAERLPLVVVGRSLDSLAERCLMTDNQAGMRQVVEHLAALGHRRIAYIGGPEEQHDAFERREGFETGMRDAGLTVVPELMLRGDYTEVSGEQAAATLLEGGHAFTALCCANDQMAFGARLTLYRRGVRVPEDLSLTGFDDLFAAKYTTPPLTTVRQSVSELGEQAAEAVLQLLASKTPSLPIHLPQLVVRESTGPVRAASPPGGA